MKASLTQPENGSTSSGFVQKLAATSIAVGLAVLGLKYLAYVFTGSVALYSDAIESIINVMTAVATFFAIRISARRPDSSHPYGHSKVEYFSSVLEGVLIIIAALAILREAYGSFLQPKMLEAPLLGLVINGAATALNAAWSFMLISQGRRRRSPALVADGRHLLTDLYTSVGVIVGVMLVAATDWQVLDPIIAAVVALNIVWAGWGLMKESVGGLMDEVLPAPQLARVKAIVDANAEGAIEVHDLRTRHAGRVIFIDFHLILPGKLTVDEAHAICDRLENALRSEFPEAVISIHVEPEAKRKGGAMTFGD